jgi:hypothetical protein
VTQGVFIKLDVSGHGTAVLRVSYRAVPLLKQLVLDLGPDRGRSLFIWLERLPFPNAVLEIPLPVSFLVVGRLLVLGLVNAFAQLFVNQILVLFERENHGLWQPFLFVFIPEGHWF